MPPDLAAKKVLAFFGEREPKTFAGTTQLARALQAGGDKTQAAAVVRRGWVELDAGEDDEKQFLAKYGAMLKPEDHVARLDRLLWDGKQDATKRMLSRVDAGYRALAEARIALRNETKNADKLVAKVPKKLQRDAGLVYERARFRRRKENYESVPDLFFPPLQEVARPDTLWREIDDAARRALARGQVKIAYKLAIQHGAKDGTTFAEGEWLAGWIALRFLHEPKTAYAHFTRLHGGVGSPISKARAAYWAGRAAEDLKKKVDASSWYAEAAQWSTTYYGQLAAQRSGQRGPLQFAAVPKPTGQQAAEFAKGELARVVQQLHEIDQDDRAKTFPAAAGGSREDADRASPDGRAGGLARAQRPDGGDRQGVAAGRRRDGGPALSGGLRSGRRPSGGGAHPRHHPPGERLSSGCPELGRRARPDAADAGDGEIGRDPDRAALLQAATDRRPDLQHARWAAPISTSLIEDYGGSYVLAIAGYNAGPRRVAEWIGTESRSPHEERGCRGLDREHSDLGDPQLRAARARERAGLPPPHRRHADRGFDRAGFEAVAAAE